MRFRLSGHPQPCDQHFRVSECPETKFICGTPAKDIDIATGEETTKQFLRGFRTVKVFHQGQLVDPPDLGRDTVMPKVLTGDRRWQQAFTAVTARLEAEGYDVEMHTRTPVEKWNGRTDYSKRLVSVGDNLAPPQQLKTLMHEWGHVRLDHETRVDASRETREVEAESVAYLLGQTIGLDSETYSVPYISHWAGGDQKLIESTMQRVLGTTKDLVGELEQELGVRLSIDAIDHALPETETNVIALPGAAKTPQIPPEATTPDVADPADHGLFATEAAATGRSALDSPDSSDAALLRAVGEELEEGQLDRFVDAIFRPDRAPEAALLLAESGRTALQTARILDRFGLDHTAIENALQADGPAAEGEPDPLRHADDEPDPLFPAEDVRLAMWEITPPDQRREHPTPTLPESVVESRRDNMLAIVRIARTAPDAAVLIEVANAFKMNPVDVVNACASAEADPNLTLAVAVALSDGDGKAAINALKQGWPGIQGGWENYAHPSMLAARSTPTLVPDLPEEAPPTSILEDHDPIRELFAEWDAMEAGTPAPTPEPTMP